MKQSTNLVAKKRNSQDYIYHDTVKFTTHTYTHRHFKSPIVEKYQKADTTKFIFFKRRVSNNIPEVLLVLESKWAWSFDIEMELEL